MNAPNHSFLVRSQSNKSVSVAMALITITIVLIVMQPYLAGYRLSGDDIWFLILAIEGGDVIRGNAFAVAEDQGRIGQLLMIPLNTLGSWLSDNLIGRVLILALYVFQLMLFAVYVARILRFDVWLFLFILLVALHPLTYSFMPPNAYPLQNTVPFIVILLSRIAIVTMRSRGIKRPLWTMMLQGLFALGMFVSEFAVTFGVSLLIAEYIARLQLSFGGGRQWRAAIRDTFIFRRVLADGVAVLAVIIPYGIYRLLHPGMYDGNSPGGIMHPLRVIGTALGHIRHGTAFPRLGGGLSSASVTDILVATLTGGLVAFCLYSASRGVSRLRMPIVTGIMALLLAVFVSLPIAVSLKYQDACINRGACGYLDSRISYLWVSMAVMALVAYISMHPLGRVTRRQALGMCCFVLGVMAALTSIYNSGKARDMRRVSEVWERANNIACTQPAILADKDALLEAIDPQRLIANTMNSPDQAGDFWKTYVEWRSKKCIVR